MDTIQAVKEAIKRGDIEPQYVRYLRKRRSGIDAFITLLIDAGFIYQVAYNEEGMIDPIWEMN